MMRFVLVAVLAVSAVYCTPVEKVKRQVEGDIEFVPIDPMRAMYDGQLDMDNPRFMPQFNGTNDFFNRFSDMANMLRAWFNRPFFRPDDFDDDDDDFGKLPPNYDNSTFSTKVVNGSIITVNETIQKHESNDSSFVWRIKVVQIRPENDTSSNDGSATEGTIESKTETVELAHQLPSGDDDDNDVAFVPRVRRSNPVKIR